MRLPDIGLAVGLLILVELMADTDCTRRMLDIDTPPIVLAIGWIPALDASGQPTVWWETYCD